MLITSIPQYIQGLLNAKVDLTTTDLTTLFTVPTNADFNAAIVTSILVSEDSGNADTITVTLVDTSNAVFSLFKVKAVGANTTIELLTRELVLQSGESIKVQAATANRLHVVASIQDVSKTRVTTSALAQI
jgi:TctA family transporter